MRDGQKKNRKQKDRGVVRLSSAAVAGVLTLGIISGTAIAPLAHSERAISRENENYSLHNYSKSDIRADERGIFDFIFGSDFDGGTDSQNAENLYTEKIKYNLPGVYTKQVWSHKALSLRLNGGSLSFSGREINGIAYLPVRSIVGAVSPSVKVSYNSGARTLTLSGGGLYMTVTDGGFVSYANGRTLFEFSPAVILSDGRMYLPASVILKALGLTYSLEGGGVSIYGSFKPLLPAEKFYREDEVYWLSKIISAESSGEALLGQIAVGDVILNRVKSPLYPATIYGVIFDRKYGVQFSPTADGRIYGTPTYTATLAAKICLEGTSLSDNAMYFLNPRAAQSSWIVKNRPYAYTIGNHDFYL